VTIYCQYGGQHENDQSEQRDQFKNNLKTAKALGLNVPITLQTVAGDVIKQAKQCLLLAQSGHHDRADL